MKASFSTPDAIVIGAGSNGLVAANVLADSGWTVLVLEAKAAPGGAVRTGELTLPGFQHDLFSAFYPLAIASPAMHDLHLEEHGLRWRKADYSLAHPLNDQQCAVIGNDLETTKRTLDQLSPGDGAAWEQMIAEWIAVESPLLDALFRPFPPLVALGRLLHRVGVHDARRLARNVLLPARRMGEERFQSEGARLLLAGCALHSDLAPESSLSGFYGWLLCCLAQRFGFPVPEGGASGITDALVSRLTDRGGTVLCDTRVNKIVVQSGRVVEVWADNGERFPVARAVLADVPAPVLFGGLIDAEHLPARLRDHLDQFQWDSGTVKVDWALAGPVPWQAPDARQAGTVHLADDLDNLTQFAADLAMGRLSARPFVIFGQQSIADPTRSPRGTETAWAYTHVPRAIKSDAAHLIDVSHPEDENQWVLPFVERLENRIEEVAPGFRSLVLKRHVFSPRSLEVENPSLIGGAIGGGTSQLHQQLIFRPYPGMGRPETPIEGLYLASSSAHPGGGVHGAAGANAAHAAQQRAPRIRARLYGRGGRP